MLFSNWCTLRNNHHNLLIALDLRVHLLSFFDRLSNDRRRLFYLWKGTFFLMINPLPGGGDWTWIDDKASPADRDLLCFFLSFLSFFSSFSFSFVFSLFSFSLFFTFIDLNLSLNVFDLSFFTFFRSFLRGKGHLWLVQHDTLCAKLQGKVLLLFRNFCPQSK